MERNSYLVNRAFRSFLFSTVLSTVAASLAVAVDSVIVGNLLGAQPLAAISLITPVAQIFNALCALINVGGAAFAAKYIGKQQPMEAGRVCTTALCFSLLVGLLGTLGGLFALPSISALLTVDAALRPLVEQYLRIMLISMPIYLLLPGLCAIIRTDNAPRRASAALIIGNICNLALDIVFIHCFSMGIAGSSLATSCGYAIGVVVAALHFKRDAARAVVLTKPKAALIPSILLAGVPIALSSALMCIRIYCTNMIVQRFLGAASMPIMAVCFNVMLLGSMFIGGIAQAFQPIGGILSGLEDYRGLRMATANAWRTLFLCLGVLCLLVLSFPGIFLRLFGLSASSEALRALRLFLLSLPLYGANYLLMLTHQTLGRRGISIANACLDSLVVILVLYTAVSIRPAWLWSGFAVGETCVLLLVLFLSALERRKDRSLSPMLLLPPLQEDAADFSTRSDMNDLHAAMDILSAFLTDHGLADKTRHVELCCEEMLTAFRTAESKHSKYVDIRLHKEEKRLILCMISAGAPLDPLVHKREDLSLRLCDAMCEEMRYSYIALQNVVTFLFAL